MCLVAVYIYIVENPKTKRQNIPLCIIVVFYSGNLKGLSHELDWAFDDIEMSRDVL